MECCPNEDDDELLASWSLLVPRAAFGYLKTHLKDKSSRGLDPPHLKKLGLSPEKDLLLVVQMIKEIPRRCASKSSTPHRDSRVAAQTLLHDGKEKEALWCDIKWLRSVSCFFFKAQQPAICGDKSRVEV